MKSKYKMCLLIDDSSLDNFINSKIIKMSNFAKEIVVSEHAEDALAMLRDGKVEPDIIFLDIKMPVMDGFQFLEEYDKIDIDKKHTKIFILTTSLNPADIERAKHNKYVTKFVSKNLTPAVLLELAS